eukprot:g62573.t1
MVTSVRQSAEWGMGSLQKQFPRITLPLPHNADKRALVLECCFRLYNFRNRMGGRNQIRTSFDPAWILELSNSSSSSSSSSSHGPYYGGTTLSALPVVRGGTVGAPGRGSGASPLPAPTGTAVGGAYGAPATTFAGLGASHDPLAAGPDCGHLPLSPPLGDAGWDDGAQSSWERDQSFLRIPNGAFDGIAGRSGPAPGSLYAEQDGYDDDDEADPPATGRNRSPPVLPPPGLQARTPLHLLP